MAKKRTPNPEPVAGQSHELAELCLAEGSMSRLGIKGEPLPQRLNLFVNFSVGPISESPDRLAVKANLSIAAAYEDGGEPALTIKASYFLAYKFTGPVEGDILSDPRLAKPLGILSLSHVWPYWREFVQSAMTRMGLAPLRLSLLLPPDIKFE